MKKYILLLMLLYLEFFFTPHVFAAACTGLPSIGNQSLSNCTLTVAGITGVDQANNNEASVINTAALTLNSGAAVTVNAGGVLAIGSVILGGGTIAIASGGTINPNLPIYITDADGDGWASTALSSAIIYSASASGRRRVSLMRGAAVDCGEAQYSIDNACSVSATGGTITSSGGRRIHIFTGNGSFIVSSGTGTADVLVVGGGGGGDTGESGYSGGAGGGGGKVTLSTISISPQTYTITVGPGGSSDNNGNTSSIGALISSVGGNRGSYSTGGTSGNGFSGGGTGNAPYYGGGGGGASAGGGYAYPPGHGGAGIASSLSGASVQYGGGGGGAGGGGPSTAGSGVYGGGGGGYYSGSGANGAANTGGGGGGGHWAAGGTGGSGIVIISYVYP